MGIIDGLCHVSTMAHKLEYNTMVMAAHRKKNKASATTSKFISKGIHEIFQSNADLINPEHIKRFLTSINHDND